MALEGLEVSGEQEAVDPPPTTEAKVEPLDAHALAQAGRKACLVSLGELEVHQDITLDELKLLITTLPALHAEVGEVLTAALTPDHLRLRGVQPNYLPGKLFTGGERTLKKLHVSHDKNYVVQVLPEPERLPNPCLVFWCARRVVPDAAYDPVYPPVEAILRQQRPTYGDLQGLMQHITRVPIAHMELGKFNAHKHTWKKLLPPVAKKQGGRGGRGGRGARGARALPCVRDQPTSLAHGDLLAVKDLREDPEGTDDFATTENLIAVAKMAEAKARRRGGRALGGGGSGGGGGGKHHAPEVALVLFGDEDFNFDTDSDASAGDSDNDEQPPVAQDEQVEAALAAPPAPAVEDEAVETEIWSCPACTFHNPVTTSTCDICGSARG